MNAICWTVTDAAVDNACQAQLPWAPFTMALGDETLQGKLEKYTITHFTDTHTR